ncbi:Retrovirus-related Pol poly from transposon [Brachionus plicatilis]|uniref:Retrovirus-related Pol poly from transposon n=1 Tax=Brachionus plicatilis TaxID=10195 RepID=A0A3M7QZ64_BRAPC|nr:Retrovirus-related Pol poly from transposon [Brachionus plicatilis]
MRIFKGLEDDDFDQWFDEFDTKTHTLDDEEYRLKLFKAYIGGRARECLEGFKEPVRGSYTSLVKEMRKLFCKSYPEHYVLDLGKVKRESNESLTFYGLRVTQMFGKAYPQIQDPAMIEQLTLDYFLRGLNTEICTMVRVRRPKDIREAIRFAEISEVDKGKAKKEQLLVLETTETTSEKGVVDSDKLKTTKSSNYTSILSKLDSQAHQVKQQYEHLKGEFKNLKQRLESTPSVTERQNQQLLHMARNNPGITNPVQVMQHDNRRDNRPPNNKYRNENYKYRNDNYNYRNGNYKYSDDSYKSHYNNHQTSNQNNHNTQGKSYVGPNFKHLPRIKRCYLCNQPGQLRAFCPTRNSDKPPKYAPQSSANHSLNNNNKQNKQIKFYEICAANF